MALRRSAIKNQALEVEQFRRRAFIAFAAVVAGLLVLAGWYFHMQVLQHRMYSALAESNQIKPRPIVPGRGLIYDRKGRILADNVPQFRLDVTPDQVDDMATLVQQLSTRIELKPEDIEAFDRARDASRPHAPVTLKAKLTDEEIARFSVDRWQFPGVEIVPYFGRVYPYKDLFTHIIGYVGRVDARDKEKMVSLDAAFSHVGKTGLERYYEEVLRGKVGYERIETNVNGRALRTLGVVPAKPGDDLRLTIDLDLQRAMVEAFGNLEGTAVAIDPRTGGILAMVSLPSYDANLFVNGISHDDYAALNENPSRPQFNRIVLGGVAPGSTVKPFLALAGLESGLRTPEDKVLSTGMFYIPGQKRGYGDSHRGGHGWTDMRKSIYASVNTYYYKLALDLGMARFDQYLGKYGFGSPTGIDMYGEIGGILPSPEWKRTHIKGASESRWYIGDTVISGIGQGFWKVTPLQLAQGVAALGNGGLLRRPHLVEAARTGFGGSWGELPQSEPRRISDSPAHLQVIREGMIGTVHGAGTATNIRAGLTYIIASKTGTAQVASRRSAAAVNPRNLPMNLRHRALFEAYAPADNPTIAVAVAVEGGGYGADTAAPIARKIMDAWITGKMPSAGKDGKDMLADGRDPMFADAESGAIGTESFLVPGTIDALQDRSTDMLPSEDPGAGDDNTPTDTPGQTP
ncbi:penicillin-binding protein 2 [Lysobacter silvestris]|uniref:Peptidoglycan D,D-transpeptidase MrdA n=1 Tax=Solilutibacter silvestris TaxID=1645665 RepID=A0A2K1Q0G2_9GAMM|nr:penicillin-binding protein 2 [Lysobacter silvestris]